MGKIKIYIYQFFFIIYIIFEIIILKLSIFTSNLLRVLFYTISTAIFIISIGSIIYPIIGLKCSINFIVKHNKVFKYWKIIFTKGISIIYLLSSISDLLDNYNGKNYKEFIKNCPFTFNTELIIKNRRCELFNTKNNTLYKYQYICSYNASENFEGDTTKEGFDKIKCIYELNSINENNEIISKFKKIYNNKNNNGTNFFYCSRIDVPEKNTFIKDEYCDMENDYNYLIK